MSCGREPAPQEGSPMERSGCQVLLVGLMAAGLACSASGCKSKPKQQPAPAPTPAASSPVPVPTTPVASTSTSTPTSTPGPAPAPAAAPSQLVSVEQTARVSGTARVKSVDYTTRVVTLEEPSGRTVTLVAGNEVRRLNEVKPGDN